MSLRRAKACIYEPGAGRGGWREQVQACEARSCPLWPHRPTPRRRTEKANDSLAFHTQLQAERTDPATRVGGGA